MGLWTRKSVPELIKSTLESEESPQLKRTLTSFDLVMLGIGCVIGAGLFSITGIAAAENAGPAVIISFLLAALGCALAGLCYSELAAMIPIAGSAYTYAYATLGEFIAWVIGWDLILEYAIGAAAVAISWSSYCVSLLQDFDLSLPSAFVASPLEASAVINLPALFIIVVISILLILGIRQSARVNSFMVAIKVGVVILFIGLGIWFIQPANHTPFIPPNEGTFGAFGWSGILRAAGVVFFAYIGFDAVSTAAQEAKTPQKAVPYGILGSLFICTVLYVLFAYVLTGLVHYKQLDVAAPVALAIEQTPYPWLKILVKLAILAGLTSVILVLLLGQSRIFYSMARDGLLPSVFGTVHPTFRTPWISNLVLMVFSGLIAAFAPLSAVGHMTSIGTLFAFTLVCAGVWVLRYRHPEIPRPFKVPFVPWVPLLGIGVCVTMMLSLGWVTWVRLLIWLSIGLVIYFFSYKKRALSDN